MARCSPRILDVVEVPQVTSEPFWVDCGFRAGQTYRIHAVTEGSPDVQRNAAIIGFCGDSGRRLTQSETIGTYVFLRSGPGTHVTERLITIEQAIGVALLGDRCAVTQKSLAIKNVCCGDDA